MLQVPPCDHLHALPYFPVLERNIQKGKRRSVTTHRVKLFLVMRSIAMPWPVITACSWHPCSCSWSFLLQGAWGRRASLLSADCWLCGWSATAWPLRSESMARRGNSVHSFVRFAWKIPFFFFLSDGQYVLENWCKSVSTSCIEFKSLFCWKCKVSTLSCICQM